MVVPTNSRRDGSRLAVMDSIERRREILLWEGPLRNNYDISPKNTAYRDRAAGCRVSRTFCPALGRLRWRSNLFHGAWSRLVDCSKWMFCDRRIVSLVPLPWLANGLQPHRICEHVQTSRRHAQCSTFMLD
jgi:hypothetical protein